MPLRVTTHAQVSQVIREMCLSTSSARSYNVDMSGFATAANPLREIALATDGAGPCVIILVHMAPGHGALGHYPGHSDALAVVSGVEQMVGQMASPTAPTANTGPDMIERIVLAAGHQGGQQGQQHDYQNDIREQLEFRYRDAIVEWVEAPPGVVLSSCFYLPTSEEAGFMDGGTFNSSAANQNHAEMGIRVHGFVYGAAQRLPVRRVVRGGRDSRIVAVRPSPYPEGVLQSAPISDNRRQII